MRLNAPDPCWSSTPEGKQLQNNAKGIQKRANSNRSLGPFEAGCTIKKKKIQSNVLGRKVREDGIGICADNIVWCRMLGQDLQYIVWESDGIS